MLKKITIITTITFFVCFLGAVITFPLGIKTALGNVEQLLETTNITPEKIEIPSNITTLDIDLNYYYRGHILTKQSPDDTAYIEIFNGNTYSSTQNTITINYIDETTAKIGWEEAYGKLKLNKEMISKTIVKELQNYPDAILYIPTRMNLITNNSYYYFDNIHFNNKEELFQKEKTEEEEEEILEQAERIRNRQQEEEERILERAEEIIEQRQIKQEIQEMEQDD